MWQVDIPYKFMHASAISIILHTPMKGADKLYDRNFMQTSGISIILHIALFLFICCFTPNNDKNINEPKNGKTVLSADCVLSLQICNRGGGWGCSWVKHSARMLKSKFIAHWYAVEAL